MLASEDSALGSGLVSPPIYSFTSAAADRAAFMEAAFAAGTGFQRFSFELQYFKIRFGVSAASV
jgi:hypothetical protein